MRFRPVTRMRYPRSSAPKAFLYHWTARAASRTIRRGATALIRSGIGLMLGSSSGSRSGQRPPAGLFPDPLDYVLLSAIAIVILIVWRARSYPPALPISAKQAPQ